MGTEIGGQFSGWTEIWRGDEPTASSAEQVLTGNGLEVKRQRLQHVKLYVPEADADTARELLRDWGI